MADVLDQIQNRQLEEQQKFVAQLQADMDWRSTFGQIPPDEILRETRDMTSLVNNAIERKLQIAAQTDENAQRIYINNEKFKEWKAGSELRDEATKKSLAREAALTRATLAETALRDDQLIREAAQTEQTALSQLEMNSIEEDNMSDDAAKLAQLRSFQGRYPAMGKEAISRLESMTTRFTPPEADVPAGTTLAEAKRDKSGKWNYTFKPVDDKGFKDIASAKEAFPDSTDSDFKQEKNGQLFYRPKGTMTAAERQAEEANKAATRTNSIESDDLRKAQLLAEIQIGILETEGIDEAEKRKAQAQLNGANRVIAFLQKKAGGAPAAQPAPTTQAAATDAEAKRKRLEELRARKAAAFSQ